MDNTKKIGFNKRFFIKTYGCDANKRDSEFISGILEKLGFKKTENVNDAHLFLLNTCAIREGAEEKVFGRIGFLKEIKKNNKNIKIGICGCMVHEKNVVKKILAIKHVDFIMGTNDISKLETILHDLYDENKKNFQILNNFNTIYENLPSKRFSKIKAFVNITYGCSNFCTYCIVPYTRGPMRSRKKEVIINEIKHLIKIGYQEIILLGQNVNSYGVDFKEKYFFNDLLSDIAKLKIPRIRFSTSNPWNFTKEIVDVMKKYKNIMPSIHLPIQSGSEEILKKMNRWIKIDHFMKIVEYIRKNIKDCSISTDLIVGFPNETEEQFNKTIDLYNKIKFDNAYTFIYSSRENTLANKIDDKISYATKLKRLNQLNAIVKKYAKLNCEKWIGKIVKVLVEGKSKTNDKMLTGYMPQLKVVNFKGKISSIGKIVDVKIISASNFSLNGIQKN